MSPTTIRRLAILGLAMMAVAAGGCRRSEPVEIAFTVEGMHCEGCEAAITQALERVDGVEAASADQAAGIGIATCRSRKVDPQQLAGEIEGLGYTVTSVRVIPNGS
jgi:copper chaperone